MNEGTGTTDRQTRALRTLVMVNVVIWAVSLIALVFVMQHAPSAKGMFPILGGGAAVGISLISVVNRSAGTDAKQT